MSLSAQQTIHAHSPPRPPPQPTAAMAPSTNTSSDTRQEGIGRREEGRGSAPGRHPRRRRRGRTRGRTGSSAACPRSPPPRPPADRTPHPTLRHSQVQPAPALAAARRPTRDSVPSTTNPRQASASLATAMRAWQRQRNRPREALASDGKPRGRELQEGVAGGVCEWTSVGKATAADWPLARFEADSGRTLPPHARAHAPPHPTLVSTLHARLRSAPATRQDTEGDSTHPGGRVGPDT
eukprot:3385884-Rhodomonas_salina.1